MEWTDEVRSIGGLTILLQLVGLLAVIMSRVAKSLRIRLGGQRLFLIWMGLCAIHSLTKNGVSFQHWLMMGTACALLAVCATIDLRSGAARQRERPSF